MITRKGELTSNYIDVRKKIIVDIVDSGFFVCPMVICVSNVPVVWL